MAQWLNALLALSEDPYQVAHTFQNCIPRTHNTLIWPLGLPQYILFIHNDIHINKNDQINLNKIKNKTS